MSRSSKLALKNTANIITPIPANIKINIINVIEFSDLENFFSKLKK